MSDADNLKITKTLSRRTILVSGLGLVVASGCSSFSTHPDTKKTNKPTSAKSKESAALGALVKSGKLPPLQQRLPEKPLIVQPVQRAGSYGGTWENAVLGPGDSAWLGMTLGYENLVRWNFQESKVLPNVAEKVDVGAGGREYTFTLRKGIRWSDGQPLTADDVVFAQNDVINNPDLSTASPDNPAKAVKIDDHTVKIVLERPEGLYLQQTATITSNGGARLLNTPFHYLKKFHKKYNPDADSLAKKAGEHDWVALFQKKGGTIAGSSYNALWQNPDLPTLFAWHVVTPLGDGTRVELERNPYYWKVDPDGRQLPYIDKVVFDVLQDAQVMLLRALDGHVNLDTYHVNSVQNKPVLARSRSKGNYRFSDLQHAAVNAMAISLNLCHKDPKKREVFQNKDFRIGLSYAINRRELINATMARQGQPYQAAPHPTSPLYNKQFAKQYTEYDVDKANSYLDKAGYTKRDSSGFRQRGDGKRISINVEVAASAISLPYLDMLTFIKGYWKKVGIEMQIKNEDQSLFYSRKAANEHDAAVWSTQGLGLEDILDPRYAFPWSNESNFAIPWAHWYRKQAGGIEPPDNDLGRAVKKQWALYDKIRATPDQQQQITLMKQIQTISADQFYAIGTVLEPKGYTIVKNDMHNVPKEITDSWLQVSPAVYNPCQFYFQS